MVENYYVRNGAIAGLIAGILTAIMVYLDLPTVEEVLEEASKISFIEQPLVVNKKLLDLVLKLSGIIACIFFVLLGVVFGGIHEYLDKKMGTKTTVLPALIAGLLLVALLTVPNILLGGSPQKTINNLVAGATYTIALTVLAEIKNPRTFKEDILKSSEIY